MNYDGEGIMAAKKTKNLNLKVESVLPCLTFNDQAEEAVNYYVGTFADSKIVNIVRSDSDGPIPKGKVLHCTFVLDGQTYTAFDGGPHFVFSQAFSIAVTCRTQEEIDAVWARLVEGGEEQPCGWLLDRFGVSWQVIPEALGRMLTDDKRGNSAKVMEVMLKTHGKFNIAAMERAYRSK